VEEPAGDPEAEAAPTTTTPADVDETVCEPSTDPAPATTTTTTTTPPTTTVPGPTDEPACDTEVDPAPTTPPPTATPVDDAPETTVAPTTDPTAPTTVPADGDEPVDGGEPEEPTEGEDEPSDAATANETAQRVGSDDDSAEDVDAPVTTAPIDTTPAELNVYDPGLRASSYDGVYAEGVPVGVAMATTRWLESGNRYDAQARGSTASGAYQVIDSTWNGYDGYDRAVLAPPEVQDQFAYESFTALLKRHGNDVSKIPVTWYIGHVPQGAEWDTVPHPEAGNTLTPRQYQAKWMKKFFSLLSEGAPVYLPSDTEALVPAIAFPVLGPVEFVDDWHFERDGGARQHEGLDLLGYEGQPIRAAFDGVITMIDDDPAGIAGNGLRLTRDDGLYANYFHLSNSETGPVLSTLEVGTRVRAGQIIGFMGSTGNAGIPHLHFELRTAEREPMAPYPAVLEAIQREQCTVGLGPWSTEFTSPAQQAEAEAAALLALADLTEEQIEGLAHLPAGPDEEVEYLTIEGPDGAQWVIGADGSVTATGEAAMIGTYQTDCPMPIDTVDENGDPIVYGTDADGLPVDELPVGWWDDEAVEWEPELDDEETYIDPWELDQADLHGADEHHVGDEDHAAVVDPRFLRMI
jgi:murein DD-endopeptidase MepM/ murein hydrolase activator NlpD